jgi:hypothetical protein
VQALTNDDTDKPVVQSEDWELNLHERQSMQFEA